MGMKETLGGLDVCCLSVNKFEVLAEEVTDEAAQDERQPVDDLVNVQQHLSTKPYDWRCDQDYKGEKGAALSQECKKCEKARGRIPSDSTRKKKCRCHGEVDIEPR